MRKTNSPKLATAFTLLAISVAQVYSGPLSARTLGQANTMAQQTLSQMTLEEKFSYISGTGGWDVKPLPRFNLPQILGADGGLGVRYTNQGNDQGVVYPSGPNLAATFNLRRAVDFGRALGYDTATGGYHYITGPGMNMYRMPYGGRNFEYLTGEDPFLGASMAPAVINGIQSRGIWADAKHFAANDQETNRFVLDQSMPERVLREMTMPPFESASKNGKVALMMCSFQKVNGEFVCENSHLLRDILKQGWGYQGFVQSDYGAVVNGLNAAQGGTDIEMLFGVQMNSTTLTPYIESGVLSVATIDDKVLRILRQIYLFDFDTYVPSTAHDMDNPASNQAALNVAREGIVLLKNKDNFLPLDRNVVRKIAVVGVLGKYAPPIGFGSAYVSARNYISEVSGMRQVASNAQVTFLDSLSLDPQAAVWTHLDSDGTTSVPGMTAEYFTNPDWSGTPAATRTETYVDLNWDSDENLPTDGNDRNTSIRWSGRITPTISGEHVFKVRADGLIRLRINGQQILDNGDGEPLPNNPIPPTIPAYTKYTLEAGQTYDVMLEYSRRPAYVASLGGYTGVRFSWASLVAPDDIASYDAVVVAAGNSNEYEGEGWDHMFELPEYQGQMIQSIAAQNPKTIVALHGGTGLKVSDWVDQVSGLLHAFYPGQNGGQALAEIIFGRVNPSAKLPISLERDIQDNPLFSYFPQFDNEGVITQTSYANDLLSGYRGYEKKGTTPLYPFGYGLSYTQFSYSGIRITPAVALGNTPVQVSFDITNTGQRAGAEVAQLYVGQRNPRLERPIKELKGYQKVFLQPGERQRVTIELNGRSLAYYNPATSNWVIDGDTFDIGVGAASNDIRLRTRLLSPYRQSLSVANSNPLPPTVVTATKVTARQLAMNGNDDQASGDGLDTPVPAPVTPPGNGNSGGSTQ
ncbi:glycoside hydrolase family 3 protein [Pseudomonas sp. CFII64]|uniref:beta-glucosidase n=1 Tax=Pseudomonas sp. CFII64 TaxID=911242 RepID=UPI00068AB637|nr:glycoside hydrolase family 3 C-terminal domain-containing protein [Pseudomonas sp. CFII64]